MAEGGIETNNHNAAYLLSLGFLTTGRNLVDGFGLEYLTLTFAAYCTRHSYRLVQIFIALCRRPGERHFLACLLIRDRVFADCRALSEASGHAHFLGIALLLLRWALGGILSVRNITQG